MVGTAENINLTLHQLANQVGAPPPDLRAAILASGTLEAFVAVGRTVASERVLKDALRLYVMAWLFWKGASADQQRSLMGFSRDLLALGVELARELEKLIQEVGQGTKRSVDEREELEEAAKVAWERGMKLRDQAERVLLQVAAKDSALRERVRNVTSTAETADALGLGLQGQAALVRELLAQTDHATATRVKATRLDERYAQELHTAGEQVVAAARAASAPVRRKVDQGEQDLLDGLNLHVLREVIDVFEAAHELDSTIPRLVPIAARRALGMSRKAVADAPA